MRNGKLHKRPRESRLKNFPADYVGSFYRTLADNVDNFVGSGFYGGIANDSNIPLRFRQRHTNNHNLTRDRINNASFRQRLDPISKNIIRRQNPLELVFEDISNLDAENPIIGSLLRDLNVKKKALASDLVKNAPNAPEKYFEIQKRLDRSRGVRYIKSKNDNKNNNNLSPPPSPPPGRRSFLAPRHHHNFNLHTPFLIVLSNRLLHLHDQIFHLVILISQHSNHLQISVTGIGSYLQIYLLLK